MANLKEVRGRIQSVNSTQQITKAMKMVAAAKLRRAQDSILQMRPYAEKLTSLLGRVSSSLDESFDNKYGKASEEVNNVLVIVVTSDRGLCGGFNSSVAKAVVALVNDKYPVQKAAGQLDILSIGKKGAEFFQRRDFNVNTQFMGVFGNLSFNTVKSAAEFVMQAFLDGKYDKVELVYNEFKNVATQLVKVEQFLPIVAEHATENNSEITTTIDYLFEPDKKTIVEELIPKSLKIQLYKAILESNAAEHGARMTAMDKATENAGELLKELKLIYNRSRQAAITTEILEIVGGAEALAKG